jgi:plastocyanin
MRNAAVVVACLNVLIAVPALAADHVVIARNGPGGRHFDPSPLTIAPGDTVTFKNDVSGLGFHNVKSDDGAITAFHCSDACGDSPVGNPSGSAWSSTVAFPTEGRIGYYCEAHGGSGGAGMSGVVIVASTPSVNVTPVSISASAEEGTSTTSAFAIANEGSAALDWTVDTSSADCIAPVAVQWLTLDPLAGSIASGAAAALVDVTLDATGLTAGAYNANICVHSNDTAHDPLTLPVSFTVNQPDLIFQNGFDG